MGIRARHGHSGLSWGFGLVMGIQGSYGDPGLGVTETVGGQEAQGLTVLSEASPACPPGTAPVPGEDAASRHDIAFWARQGWIATRRAKIGRNSRTGVTNSAAETAFGDRYGAALKRARVQIRRSGIVVPDPGTSKGRL